MTMEVQAYYNLIGSTPFRTGNCFSHLLPRSFGQEDRPAQGQIKAAHHRRVQISQHQMFQARRAMAVTKLVSDLGVYGAACSHKRAIIACS